MNTERSRRLHAARVAAVATAVVVAVYVVAVIALDLLVSYRLTSQVDSRLVRQLAEATSSSGGRSSGPVGHLGGVLPNPDDDNDAPIFVWKVARSGVPSALTPAAPSLANRTWHSGSPITLTLRGTSFRFQAANSGPGWLVAGESTVQINRIRADLVVPELLLGGALLVVVYAGSLIIGLRASAPLEQIHRRQAEFTADASHELRTPLSVIEAEVALALSRHRSPEEYQEALNRVADEGGRLRHIVDDLLWLARVDDGPQTPRSGGWSDVADVSRVATACAERFVSLAESRNVSLDTVEMGTEPTWIHANPEWVDRLIGVLVDNACKYAGTEGQVDLSVTGSGGRVVLRVDDSGPGISPEQQLLVFDRFHRGTDEPGGTGLGLAIADSVVRASHGSWSIGRSPLGGARMEVSWRRANTKWTDAAPGAHPGDRPPRPDLRSGNPQSGIP